MLVNLGPILIAILAGFVLREGFPRRLLAGCAIAFAGTVVIGGATADGFAPSWSALLCVAAALFYAVGVVAQKPVLARVSALQLTWLACTFGAIVCAPFAGRLARELAATHPSTIGWYALARTTAGRMGSTTYLVPPIAILLGWLLLDETPPALAFAGGALCLAGVYVARRRVSPAAAASSAPRPAPAAQRG
jgi:drug/metabolite transporter (DMT)-like permease